MNYENTESEMWGGLIDGVTHEEAHLRAESYDIGIRWALDGETDQIKKRRAIAVMCLVEGPGTIHCRSQNEAAYTNGMHPGTLSRYIKEARRVIREAQQKATTCA